MDFKEKVEEKRKELVDTLLQYIETKPELWERGWYSIANEAPFNPISQKKYKGLNAFYLYALGEMKGYKDPRWLTFKQAKDLGANVKQGEKSSNIFYWNLYDKSTKQSFSEESVKDMTASEREKYFDDNVRPVLKYYQVFNADQCDNMPEYKRTAEEQSMAEEERAQQNALIERVISNSAAPIVYGGNNAYYSPTEDKIKLPEIKQFKTMQDYYATALHEIAHSTGHQSRMNRDLQTTFGTQKYAKEELRAELASIFMQIDMGISIEGKHFENHGAYLASWLKAVKKDVKEFYGASADAEKISEYVAKNYAQEKVVAQEIQAEEHKEKIEQKQVQQEHKRPLIVNFYAGPGAGKTTVALELTAALKKAGYNVEYVSEYAKELVLENKTEVLKDQQHVIDEQYKRLDRFRDSVDVIVTDSPLLLGQVYGEGRIDEAYHNQIRDYYDSFDNFNLWVNRGDEEYQQAGRVENLEQAKGLDERIMSMLRANNVYYGNYKRGEIAKTVNRIKVTYNRLYGDQKEEHKEKDDKSALDIEIKQWYNEQYPNESYDWQIRDNVTFRNLQQALDVGNEIYYVIGTNDSVIREKLFSHLAEIQGKQYKEIYDMWVNPQKSREQWIERSSGMAHSAGLPFSDKFYDGEDNSDLDVYDGSMSVEDYNLRKELENTIKNDIKVDEQVQQSTQREREEQIAREDFPRDFEDAFTKAVLDEIEEKKSVSTEQSYIIKSQVKGWDDWSTAEIKNKSARESAEWLIKNGLEGEKDVKNAFGDYQTHDMADYIDDARKSAEKAIIRVANKYKQELEEQEKKEDNTKENEIKQSEQVQQVGQVNKADYGKFKEGELYFHVWWSEGNTSGEWRKNYNVTYYQILNNRVERNVNHLGVSFIEEAYEKIRQDNGKLPIEIDSVDENAFIDLLEKLNYGNKAEESGQPQHVESIKVETIAESTYVEKYMETRADYAYGAIDEDTFNKEVERLHARYKVITDDEYDQLAGQIKEEKNTKENEIKQDEQAEQVQQVGQVGQVEQAKKSEWNNIEIKKEQIVKEYGKSTMIKLLEGEYSSFVFLAPTKFIKQDEKSGTLKLSVRSDWGYELKNNGTLVELSGSELCAVFAGKEVGKSAKRVAPTYQNNRRLENIKANIPAEMKEMPNWCVYRTKWNEAKGKKDKFVLSPLTGSWAHIDDASTWTDFDTAMKFAVENNCEGLSFALDGSGISCIDLDKCIVKNGKLNNKPTTLEEGEMNETAKKLVSELGNNYCETSASGNGLHFFLKDDILSKGQYKNCVTLESGDEIEVYDKDRFISITGNLRSNTNELGKCPSATTSWLRGKLGARLVEQARPKPANINRNNNVDMSDSAVIERIRKSKKGREFDELYSGGSVIGNRSQDDLKMLNILAFFTNGDESQVERIFKQSGLYRPEKQRYLQHSIKKACASRYGSYGDNIKPRSNQQANGRR